MTTPIAKIQWCGKQVRIYDGTSDRDLFYLKSYDNDNLIQTIIKKAGKLGYIVPQIYPGKDGIVRIWL